MDFNLSRVIEVAKKLKIDQPIPKVITVAGTNKGSTVSILESQYYMNQIIKLAHIHLHIY